MGVARAPNRKKHRRAPPPPAALLRGQVDRAKRRLIWEFTSDKVAKEEGLYEKTLDEVVEYVIRDHCSHHLVERELREDLSSILGEAIMRLGGTRVGSGGPEPEPAK